MNTTEEFKKALVEIRDKSREIAAANNITQPIKGWLWFYGSWGDECIDPFYIDTSGISDCEIKERLEDITKPYQQTIRQFIESSLENSDYKHWYEENGGEGEFEFILDDTIEVVGKLSLRESCTHTQFEYKASLDDEYWDCFKEKLEVVFAMEMGYTLVVDFQGCGDSGSCDGVYIYIDSGQKKGLPYQDQKDILGRKIDDTTVNSLFEDIGYRIMDNSSVDWFNNEGGGGEIKIDLSNRTIDANVWQNFQDLDEVWSDRISFQN